MPFNFRTFFSMEPAANQIINTVDAVVSSMLHKVVVVCIRYSRSLNYAKVSWIFQSNNKIADIDVVPLPSVVVFFCNAVFFRVTNVMLLIVRLRPAYNMHLYRIPQS